ncbi:MAG: type II toxin-antitoxin system YafQ family toxin [Gemmatimonadaceae bacterium]
MLRPRVTGAFKKDRRRAERRSQDVHKLDVVMRRLANEDQLEPRFRDHKLGGDWKGFREWHVGPDRLLIYLVRAAEITFVRTGTHSDLFEE